MDDEPVLLSFADGTLASRMPRMPCSGLNSAASLTSFAVVKQIDRRGAVPGAAGVVRDQTDPLASKHREAVGAQRVEAGQTTGEPA